MVDLSSEDRLKYPGFLTEPRYGDGGKVRIDFIAIAIEADLSVVDGVGGEIAGPSELCVHSIARRVIGIVERLSAGAVAALILDVGRKAVFGSDAALNADAQVMELLTWVVSAW